MTWFKKLKDPVSSLTHIAGAIAAIPCTVYLVYMAYLYATFWHILSFVVFGVGLIMLYAASGIYHGLNVSKRVAVMLRKIDHMMIFILIAATYTPVCLVPLRGVWGYSVLAVVWTLAIGGIILKAVWIDAPRWLSAVVYVFLGWLVVVAFYPLSQAMPVSGLLLLLFGGITYTVGAVIYAAKWPPLPFKYIGYHEVFHLFVLGGSAFHIAFMAKYILKA